MEEVNTFINVARIYIRMKMTEEVVITQVAWVLSYMQGGVAEAWKDNLLNELAKEESEVKSVEQLFTKIRNDFGETLKGAVTVPNCMLKGLWGEKGSRGIRKKLKCEA